MSIVFLKKLGEIQSFLLTQILCCAKVELKGGDKMKYRIKEARQIAGLSQKELADKMGIHAATLSGYESGAHDPKSDGLMKVADICNVSVDFLLGREKEKTVTVDSDDLDALDIEFVALIRRLSDQDKGMFLDLIKAIVQMRGQ